LAELGTLLGRRYRLDQVLGQGGMATIFRATDAKLGREVAVKVLRPEFGADAQFVERFEHEAQAAASLSHPNIVQVYDYGTDEAGPYIVMEQVSGGDLASALGKKGNLPPTAVANMGQQVADALAAAHAAGLVHRDIKPSNILLSPDGRVQVADFGIAQAAAGSPVTATGITLGSVLYFSPEQARGDTATAASDIYSLGLVMFEMLTGARAFSGDSPAAVAVARLSGGIPSPMALRAEIPPALDAIVRWCLTVDPAERPSAMELSTALARFRTDPSGAAALAAAGAAAAAGGPVPVPGPTRPPTQTAYVSTTAEAERSGSGPWGWLAAGLGLLVIIASGILLFLLFSGIGEEESTPSPSPEPTIALVQTPEFVGRFENGARALAERHGLVLEIAYHETDEVQAGRVVEQLPEPLTEVPAGTTVTVTVATQVETVVVPDVHGISEQNAIAQLEASGLYPGERMTASDQLPDGYVVSTDPRAGSSVTRGAEIDYTVSLGPAVESTSRPVRTPGPTAVPTAGPTPGTTAVPTPFPSSEVALVGDFMCQDLATARGLLEEDGLVVGAIIPADPPPGDDWLVHDQKPDPGVSIPVGSKVDLMLGDPLERCPPG
jgi:beta-lactam-binding protein with PASTA domain